MWRIRSSSYTYKHIVQNLASCVGPLLSIGLFLIMGDVWTVSGYILPLPDHKPRCVAVKLLSFN